jgi:hypothetical protein
MSNVVRLAVKKNIRTVNIITRSVDCTSEKKRHKQIPEI